MTQDDEKLTIHWMGSQIFPRLIQSRRMTSWLRDKGHASSWNISLFLARLSDKHKIVWATAVRCIGFCLAN